MKIEINQERKNRTIYCTDQEWDLIRTKAEKSRQSINQYMLTKAIDEV